MARLLVVLKRLDSNLLNLDESSNGVNQFMVFYANVGSSGLNNN